jgi:hypothetical protein
MLRMTILSDITKTVWTTRANMLPFRLFAKRAALASLSRRHRIRRFPPSKQDFQKVATGFWMKVLLEQRTLSGDSLASRRIPA